jgi:hypothetical protein
MGVEYSSKHADSMEVQLVELVPALAKNVKDVKLSYGKRIWRIALKLEHL